MIGVSSSGSSPLGGLGSEPSAPSGVMGDELDEEEVEVEDCCVEDDEEDELGFDDESCCCSFDSSSEGFMTICATIPGVMATSNSNIGTF